MESNSVTLPSDDEGDGDCMPKIINTISLQDYSELSFHEDPDSGAQDVLFPQCEIKEENTENEDIKPESVENGIPNSSQDEGEQFKKEKKRLTLIHLSKGNNKEDFKYSASTSKRDDVVDSKRLALQESLFKTKELFDTFLRVCQDHEKTEEMERVVEKLYRAYGATKQEYLGSPTFQKILEDETEKVNTSDAKPWLNLKLVLDELKHNKKSIGSKLKLGESEDSQDGGQSDNDEPVIEDPKKRRHLKKLEKFLRAVNLKIKKLEEREVDWDDEDNSAYCKLDRYRAQFTKIYAKICEIKGKLPDADRPYLRKVSFAGTTYPHINRCIEKFYNKHREFPDFQDIKKLVTLALKKEGIEMPPIKIHSMAAAAFKEFGEMLKRLRQYDDYDVLCSYLDQQVDPAREDKQLQEQLAQNALLFKKREQEVLDKFAEKERKGDFGSESDEDSDAKPEKKKRKIIVTDPSGKKKNSPIKKHESNSEGSDEENFNSKSNNVMDLSSDSDVSESDSEEKGKKISPKGKGKALIGKPRIVKKGIKRNSPKKSNIPKTAISSDEESAPGNTKESLTSYLGLKGTSTTTKESKSLSDDEVMCINENKKTHKSKSSATSDETDIDKPTISVKRNDRLDKSVSNRSDLKKGNEQHTKLNTIEDSDSDVEPVVINNESQQKTHTNQARKSTGPRIRRHVPQNHVVNENQANVHETISDSSDSDNRTSGEGSSSVTRKKNVQTVTSDLGDKAKKLEDEDFDPLEPIVILSEDFMENPKPLAAKPQADSSDSDDICILSQVQTERRTVAPRKIKPNSTAVRPANAPRRPGIVTSTPIKTSKPLLKRVSSNQPNNGSSSKVVRLEITTNGSSRQMTMPQIINGASRKILSNRVVKPATKTDPIPLIEID